MTLPLFLSGCFVFSTTRKLPVPIAPTSLQTVPAEELVSQLGQRWAGLETLTAKVEIQASVMKAKEGTARDYTTFPGVILMRKPEFLRVYGRVPVIGTEMFDMVSDGKNFTLYVPSKNKAIEGSNSLETKSASQVENMRPGFFLDAMVIRGLEPEDLYQVTEDTITVEDAAKKHLYSIPEYILYISHRKPDSQQLAPLRILHVHRDDLLTYEQDIYDSEGKLETQVTYNRYRTFGTSKYPSMITIKRPLEEFQIILTVDTVVENMKLPDDQFVIKFPPDTPVQKLE